MIPKKIHYCWFGPKPYPKLVKKCINTWTDHLGDYEFFFWNESNSPMNIPFVKEAYAAKKYAFVADYVRFWALYNHGGIYLDTDMFVIKSFDLLLENRCFFGYETPTKDYISLGTVGCEENDAFLSLILEHYNNLHFSTSTIESLIIPRIVTPLYNDYKGKGNITIYNYDHFYPFPYENRDELNDFMKYITQDTYAIHLWNLSWVPNSKKLITSIIRKFKTIIK